MLALEYIQFCAHLNINGSFQDYSSFHYAWKYRMDSNSEEDLVRIGVVLCTRDQIHPSVLLEKEFSDSNTLSKKEEKAEKFISQITNAISQRKSAYK